MDVFESGVCVNVCEMVSQDSSCVTPFVVLLSYGPVRHFADEIRQVPGERLFLQL